ncbi:RWD domain-containing protein 2A [Operophtera brumata]|uniref:RWD domain-containing protein 2A n=1 Tax=Operophtera brumata TaxID=104452 RepID=A0A0L7KTE1_OPEBR|nr:RWD domain-containing protein 2A [Operophtera brumata]
MPLPTEPTTIMKEFVSCLSQQLSELDLLKSMYSNHGEITIADKGILDEINKFIVGDSEFVPNNLEFAINLVISDLKLEICVNLPVNYPNVEPDIYIRCNQLNRRQESNLNAELSDYLKNNHVGEVCLYTAITWLQDNIDTISKNQNQNAELVNSGIDKLCSSSVERFTRFWIYSHHIYNKKKREEIAKKCKELKLTGFCLPGKPGVICIEGDESACKDWWQDIKSMTWKKIVIRKIETFESTEKSNYRFNNFEELHFQSSANTKHANMSEFSKFMSKHGFSDMFNELFGFNE